MKTISELLEFKAQVEMSGGKIPKNLFICSPQIIDECLEWIGKDSAVFKTATGIQVYGVNIIRDFAEVVVY